MNRQTLAAKLVSARSRKERTRLLRNNAHLTDHSLALAIKDIAYAAWTVDPTKAGAAAAAVESVAEIAPGGEVDAVRLWLRGIAGITAGKLEQAAEDLRAASARYNAAGAERESARPLVALLIALAMLGRYDEAVRAARSAIRVFEKFGDELEAGKIELNMSNIFARRGMYRRSETHGLSALRRFEAIGEREWQIMAENDLANTYAELNEFAAAEEYYLKALRAAANAGMTVTEAEIEASFGNLALARGRYGEALEYLERSRGRYDRLAMKHQSAVAELEIAGIYLELNLLPQSIELYRRAIPILKRLKMRGEEARAHAELGQAALASGDKREARRELKKAEELFEAEGNRTAVLSVKLARARAEFAAGKIAAANESLRAVTASRSAPLGLQLSARWLRAEIDSAAGSTRKALAKLQKLTGQAQIAQQPAIEQAAWNSLGRISRALGDAAAAEKHFLRAIGLTETMRAPLAGEEFRMAYLAARLEPFYELSEMLIEQDRIAEAFEWTERSRSRVMVDAMLDDADGDLGSGPVANEARRLREELNWFYTRAARANDGEAVRIRKDITKREKRFADLLRRLESRSRTGGGDDLRRTGVLSDLQRALGTDRAFVEYVEDRQGSISAFVITADSICHFPAMANADEIGALVRGLRFQFDTLRYPPVAIAGFGDMLKTKADKYLEKLGELLLHPVEQTLAGKSSAVIAPSGILHYVPFHALRRNGRYMIEDRDVSYAPSATSWIEIRRRGGRPLKSVLLIAYADENIPEAESEAAVLGRRFTDRTLFTGKNATFAAYQADAPDHDIIHIACHGQFRPDDPEFSSLHLADGWVTVKDICRQRLRASLVTLSACETGLNEIAKGEELIGLVRGFLTAGAASIVVTLWTVNDSAAVELMEKFYENLQRAGSISASLRIAQLSSIKRGDHPYFWSPFMAIGD